VQHYRYFVSQSSEFCRHNPLCCFSTNVYCCCLFHYDSVWKLLGTPLYMCLQVITTSAYFNCYCITHTVSNSHDVDSKFNTFLNILIKIFEASFPPITKKKVSEINEWKTMRIKASCKHK